MYFYFSKVPDRFESERKWKDDVFFLGLSLFTENMNCLSLSLSHTHTHTHTHTGHNLMYFWSDIKFIFFLKFMQGVFFIFKKMDKVLFFQGPRNRPHCLYLVTWDIYSWHTVQSNIFTDFLIQIIGKLKRNLGGCCVCQFCVSMYSFQISDVTGCVWTRHYLWFRDII